MTAPASKPTDAPTSAPAPSQGDFYVGYLPVHPAARRALRFIVPITAWCLCLASLVWALSQRPAGTAVWDDAHVRTFTGRVVAKPYPMLITAGPSPSVYLLVEAGKHGGQRAAAFDNQTVTISGWLLERDGRRIIELEPGTSAFRPESSSETAAPPLTSVGDFSGEGEIVDSKCFLGAMKPGDGKAHKDCAALCLRGGIPPMLVCHDRAGKLVYILLTSPTLEPLNDALWPIAADPVTVRGELVRLADLYLLKTDLSRITPR